MEVKIHLKEKDIPLQAKVGDMAIFIQNSSYEIEYEEERYIIVPNSAIH